MKLSQIPSTSPKSKFNLWLITTIVLAVLLIAGGVVFAWQKSANDKIKNDLQSQINTLQNQVQQLTKTTPTDETADWKTYKNERYGFEFKYPTYFNQMIATTIATRDVNPYETKDVSGLSLINYHDKITALLSLKAKRSDNIPYEDLKINIFPLNQYVFNDAPGGGDYGYNKTTNSWWEMPGTLIKQPTQLERLNNAGWQAIKLGLADMGSVVTCYAIPQKSSDTMIEICLTEMVPLDTEIQPYQRSNLESIISTLVLTK